MEIIKKYKVLLVLALLVLVGVFLFFYRMYHNDIKALEDFVASYEKFDKAISDRSGSEARDALLELNIKSVFRLSSLIKNEKELMSTALEIAELSQKEFDNFKAQRGRNIDIDTLTKDRKAAYARFLELAEIKE